MRLYNKVTWPLQYKIVQRAINAKAKMGLKSNTIVWNSNIYFSRGYCLSNNIVVKVQTIKTIFKEPHLKKIKTKDLKLILSFTNVAKLSKPEKNDWKFKKKSFDKEKSGKIPQQLITILSTSQRKCKSKTSVKLYILSTIKKAIILAIASNFQKTSISLGNLHISDE